MHTRIKFVLYMYMSNIKMEKYEDKKYSKHGLNNKTPHWPSLARNLSWNLAPFTNNTI